MAPHEVLGEGLAGLELSRRAGRAENQSTLGSQPIGQAGAKRCFRTNHGQIDLLPLDQTDHSVDIEDVDIGGDAAPLEEDDTFLEEEEEEGNVSGILGGGKGGDEEDT